MDQTVWIVLVAGVSIYAFYLLTQLNKYKKFELKYKEVELNRTRLEQEVQGQVQNLTSLQTQYQIKADEWEISLKEQVQQAREEGYNEGIQKNSAQLEIEEHESGYDCKNTEILENQVKELDIVNRDYLSRITNLKQQTSKLNKDNKQLQEQMGVAVDTVERLQQEIEQSRLENKANYNRGYREAIGRVDEQKIALQKEHYRVIKLNERANVKITELNKEVKEKQETIVELTELIELKQVTIIELTKSLEDKTQNIEHQ